MNHTVTVHRISSARDDATYDLTHDDCADAPDCFVAEQLNELGVDSALIGVWEKGIVDDGLTLTVDVWVDKYDVPGEPVEYDAGLEVDWPGLAETVGDERLPRRLWHRSVEDAQLVGDLL